MTDVISRLAAALAGRYTIERELGAGGMLAAALAGRYTIERELGAGGIATVYLVYDVHIVENLDAR
jgi:hypothetical protein